MENSFFNRDEVKQLGFKKVGDNVYISRKASFYDIEKISIGNNVRIDDFCILSGNITLGSFIHISAHTLLYGKRGLAIDDFSGLSPNVIIFSETDDFCGDYMIGPMVPERFRNVIGGKVTIKKYIQVGAGCVILPGVTIGEGVAVGSMSLVTKSLDEWSVYVGIPAKFHKKRQTKLKLMADDFLKNIHID
jgi:galactoside O-acetyltransferase